MNASATPALDNADVLAWIESRAARGNEFASSLQAGLRRYGSLTFNQLAAVRRIIQQDAERANGTSVAGEGFTKLLEAFARASESGIKHPKLRVAELTFSPAKATSNNPGHVYVKANGEYAGKVTPAGQFFGVWGLDRGVRDTVARVGRDPLAEAVAHGKATGCCAICGRQLTDAESVERGIGPICAERFGW